MESKTATTFVYFVNEPASEGFDEELSMMSPYNDRECQLAYELDNVGLESEWLEGLDMKQYPTGFYEVEYEWDTESEYVDGYIAYTYSIIVGIVSMRKSFKARLVWWKKMNIEPAIDMFFSLFQRRWGIDIEYGGIGHGSSGYWLPQVLWRRATLGHRELPWGPDYTTAYIRRS